jgi:hypothetical protein
VVEGIACPDTAERNGSGTAAADGSKLVEWARRSESKQHLGALGILRTELRLSRHHVAPTTVQTLLIKIATHYGGYLNYTLVLCCTRLCIPQ